MGCSNKCEPKFFLVNESTALSAGRDIVTFGTMTLSFIALHFFAGGAIMGQIIIAVAFFFVITRKRLVKEMTVEEAKEYLSAKAVGGK